MTAQILVKLSYYIDPLRLLAKSLLSPWTTSIRQIEMSSLPNKIPKIMNHETRFNFYFYF